MTIFIKITSSLSVLFCFFLHKQNVQDEQKPIIGKQNIVEHSAISETDKAKPVDGEWSTLYNLSTDDYQKEMLKKRDQGFRPIQASGYNDQISVIFEERKYNPDWTAYAVLTKTELQETLDKLTKQGYQPVHVSGFASGNQKHYTAIFEKRVSTWEMRYDLTAAQYQTELDKWKDKGYQPTDISVYTVNGQALFAVVFEKIFINAPGWFTSYDLTKAAYQSNLDTWIKKGYRLKIVCAYAVGNEARYAVLWKQPVPNTSDYAPSLYIHTGIYEPRPWHTNSDLDAQAYQNELDTWSKKGYHPIWVNGMTLNGQNRFAVIWEQD